MKAQLGILIVVTGSTGRQVVPAAAGCWLQGTGRRRRGARDGIEVMTGDLAKGEGPEAAVDGCTARAITSATRMRPRSGTWSGTWSGQRRGPGRSTWC